MQTRPPELCSRVSLVALLLALLVAPVDPVEVYDAEQVIPETVFVVDGGRELTPRHLTFRTGGGRRLSDPEFYAYVDQPDLAKAWRHRHQTRVTLIGVGIGMVVAGGGVTLSSIGASGRTNETLVGTGVGLMFGGIVPLCIGGFLSPHPVDNDTLLSLARDKNTRLRRELGLPIDLHFQPVIGSETTGVRFWGRF